MKKDFHVRFKFVEVYYFSRCLGIDKVPEKGNNPLGMECVHFKLENFDITKRNLKSPQFSGDGDSINKLNKLCTSTPKSSKNSHLDQCEEDNESIHSIKSIDYTKKSLQPMNPIQRKKCLEGAGVVIDDTDDVSRNPKLLSKLRETRKQVGCKCSNTGKCDSSKCICSSEGISCQSDGHKFPCKCGVKCSNKAGKRVYSYYKIKFHYNHILNRNDVCNEDVDINVLSTLTGDCAVCCTLSDEKLKICPQPNLLTRSRKRAGENDIEDLSLLKQIMKVEQNNVLTNGTRNFSESNILSQILLGSHSSNVRENIVNNNDDHNYKIGSDTFSYSLMAKLDSVEFSKLHNPIADDNFNKENIDLNLKNKEIINETNSPSFFVPNKISTDFHSPLQVQIPSGSLISPCSSFAYQDSHFINNYSNFNNLPIISSTISYQESFLNEESFNIVSPLLNKTPSIKLNPISLAPSVDISTEEKLYHRSIEEKCEITNRILCKKHRYSNIFKFVNFNDCADISPDSVESSKTSLSSDDVSEYLFPRSKDNSFENNNMTNQLEQLHLTLINSDPLLLVNNNNNSCKIDSPIKSEFSIRTNRKYKTRGSQSPIKHNEKRKNPQSKFLKSENFMEKANLKTCQNEIPLNAIGEIIDVQNSIKIQFRPSLDISFFDIPLSNDLSDCSNEFQLDSNVVESWNTK